MAATMKAHPSLPLALTGWPRQSLALARDSRRFDVVRQRAAPRAAAAAPPPRLAGGELVVLVLTPFSFDALARFNRCHPAATLIGRATFFHCDGNEAHRRTRQILAVEELFAQLESVHSSPERKMWESDSVKDA